MAEFALNNKVNRSTGYSPFYLNHGRHPFDGFSPKRIDIKNESAENFVKNIAEVIEDAKAALSLSQREMKKYYVKKRREREKGKIEKKRMKKERKEGKQKEKKKKKRKKERKERRKAKEKKKEKRKKERKERRKAKEKKKKKKEAKNKIRAPTPGMSL